MPSNASRQTPETPDERMDGFQQIFSGAVLIIWGSLHWLDPFLQNWDVPPTVDVAFLAIAAGVHPGIRSAVIAAFRWLGRIGRGPDSGDS